MFLGRPQGWVQRDLKQLFAITAGKKHIEFSVQVEEDVPQEILLDPHRLRQVLINLLGNALKFTPTGKVELVVTIEPEDELDHGTLNFFVMDTGVGIPLDRQKHLFQAFYQGGAGTSRRFGGTGLGLALSRKMAQALGGELQLEWSVPHHGSCFRLSVPVVFHGTVSVDSSVEGTTDPILRAKVDDLDLRGVRILLACVPAAIANPSSPSRPLR